MAEEHLEAEIITADTPFVPEDDNYHPPIDDDPYLVETNWWSFNIPERRIGCWLHCAYSVNKGTATWRVYVWDANGSDPQRLAYYKIRKDVPMPADPDLREITFPDGGYSVRMLEPLMRYAISYSDPAADFSINFVHDGVHPPRRYAPGEPPAMFSPHLDQLGHVTGELVLNGEPIAIDCYSIRDRTWGPRGGHHSSSQKPQYRKGEHGVLHPGGPRWREIERERGRGRIQYIFGHAGARTGFKSFVRPQDGDADGWSPLNVGWLLKDGVFEHLDKAKSRMRNYRDPLTGWTEHMEVELVDVSGRTMRAEGFAVSYICESGSNTNALMRWEFDGDIGWGEDQDIWKPSHFSKMLRALRATGCSKSASGADRDDNRR